MPKAALKLAKQPSKIEQAASRYVELKEKIAQMENEAKAIAIVLKGKAYKGQEDGNALSVTVGRFKLSVSQVNRETFNLKEARLVIDESVLSPFIKKTSSDMLRVKAVK